MIPPDSLDPRLEAAARRLHDDECPCDAWPCVWIPLRALDLDAEERTARARRLAFSVLALVDAVDPLRQPVRMDIVDLQEP